MQMHAVIHHKGWQEYHIAEGRGEGQMKLRKSIRFPISHCCSFLIFVNINANDFGLVFSVFFLFPVKISWWAVHLSNSGSLWQCVSAFWFLPGTWLIHGREQNKWMDTIQRGSSVQLCIQKLTCLLPRAHIAWNNNVLLLKISMTI